MSILRRAVRAPEQRWSPSRWSTSVPPPSFSAAPNFSGQMVDEETALQVATVMACVTLLSDTVSMMPLHTFRISAQTAGSERQWVPLPAVFERPNETQDTDDFVYQIVASLALHGNAYVFLDRRAGGLTPDMMLPLPAPQVTPQYREDGRTVEFKYDNDVLPPERLLHLKYLSLPGNPAGVSPLSAQANTIGVALAMQRHVAQFYSEGATPSGILSTDQALTVEQIAEISRQWNREHQGRRRTAVLQGGVSFSPITASAADQQLVQAREQQMLDIARAYKVPPWAVGLKGDPATYQNVESAMTLLTRFAVMPFVRRIETALTGLLPAGQIARFNMDSMMRADTLTRYRTYVMAVQNGLLSPNEVRELENREPYDGGNEMLLSAPGAVVQPVGVDANVDDMTPEG
jgi:HK97 family phage portal protein